VKTPGTLTNQELGTLVARVLDEYETRYIKIPPEGGCFRVEYKDGDEWKEKVIRSHGDLEKIARLTRD
jgi:hypothetical protein